MLMRIIAGEAKGRKLFAPPGLDTRPTTDRVRESLFAILGPRLDQAAVLDLFAGSGALALEALSRGAQWAALCDSSPAAIRVIRRNVGLAGFEARARVLPGDWRSALRRLQGARFDLVFLDPPYRQVQLYGQAMEALEEAGLLAEDVLVVLERLSRCSLTVPSGFQVVDSRRCGDTTVDLAKKEAGQCG